MHPNATSVAGDTAFADLAAVPGGLDGAVVMVSAERAAEVVAACIERGIDKIWLFQGIGAEPTFYFLHSYYFKCAEAGHVLATTHYGGEFASAIGHGSIYGVQFHPEKSHHNGIQLLKNFAELPTC